MKDEKALIEQEFILDNIVDREKSKTYYTNKKSVFSRENDNLRFSSEFSKGNKYLEDNNIKEDVDKGLKDLVIKDNNVIIFYFNFKN
jgi:hypothetical protein